MVELESRKLNVYFYSKTSPAFIAINPQRQAHVMVAAPTQKRAAELFDCSPTDISQHGGVTQQKPVQEMCRAEPEVVFVTISHDEYIREADVGDMSKMFKLDMRDPDLYGYETEHAAFGTISATRFSGDVPMFQVDYMTGHGIALTISTAVLNRNGATDRVHQRNEIVRVEMSEIQWARMLSSMNSGEIPVTLKRYRDPQTGMFLAPKLPEQHVADMETFRAEVAKRADEALTGVAEARAKLSEIMKGPLRKGDLQEVIDALTRAEMMAVNNLPYVTERAHETINTAAEYAKAEITAHVDYSMQRLGERALGERLEAALAAGVDLGAIGRAVSETFAQPSETLRLDGPLDEDEPTEGMN